MLAGHERCSGDLKVGGYRRDHGNRVEVWILQKFLVVGRSLRGRITAPHRREARFIRITNPTQLGRLVLGKVAQQIRPPIATSNHANCSCAHWLERIAVIEAKVNLRLMRSERPGPVLAISVMPLNETQSLQQLIVDSWASAVRILGVLA